MKVFVISLKKAKNRRIHISNMMKKYGIDFEFFDAFDADFSIPPNIPHFAETLIKTNPVRFNKGAVACTYSHYGVYRHIVENNIEKACILEDDALLTSNFFDEIVESASKRKALILLNYKSTVHIDLKKEAEVTGGYALYAINNMSRKIFSAAAYIITNDICKKILDREHAEDLADNWQAYINSHCINKVYCIYPLPVKDAGFKSSINHYEPGKVKIFHSLLFVIENNLPIISRGVKAIRKLFLRKCYPIRILNEV